MAQEIKVENRIPFAELGNAIGTTNEDYKAHMEQEFFVADPVNPDHEKIITRSDFEDAMASMQCWYLSDEAMQSIADQVTKALATYPPENITDENDLSDALCKEEEEALRAFGVPYYEDEVKAPKKGARVFSVDYGYATYLGEDKEGMAKLLTDDGQKKTTYIGLIVEEY